MDPDRVLIYTLLDSLKVLLSAGNRPAENRDTAIRRFLQLFDLLWHSWQCTLTNSENKTYGSPEETVKAFFKKGNLSEEQVRSALAIVGDYNLACRDYNEDIAWQIFEQLPSYVIQLENWIALMEKSR
jgi:hypothetical protein